MILNSDARRTLLSGILRPIAHFCVRYAASLPEILEQLKCELVLEAEKEIKRRGSKTSVSMISAITGITRREVDRILHADNHGAPAPNIAGRVLVQWSGDPKYLTANRKPKILSFGTDNSEFSTLVRAVSKDTSAAAILFELKRLGAVEETRAGLRLVQSTAMYRSDPVKAAGLVVRNIETLVMSAEENLNPTQNIRNLFLRTEFDNISKNDLPKIKQWVLKQGVLFHEQVRHYIERWDRDLNPTLPNIGPEERGKVVVGSFSLMSETVRDSSN